MLNENRDQLNQFNTSVEHGSTFVEQQMLQDVEPCVIGLRLNLCSRSFVFTAYLRQEN